MSGDVREPPIGVARIESYWSRALETRAGRAALVHEGEEWMLDGTMLGGLGLNLKETLDFLFSHSPSLVAFEAWIIEKNRGCIEGERIDRLNSALAGTLDPRVSASAEPVLLSEDLAFFEEHGYVVLHDAVSAERCAAAEAAIWEYLRLDPLDPLSWQSGAQAASIWVPLIHHPALEANRRSERIRRAFEQLWGRSDLWPVIDQTGFNTPEGPGWRFPGPHLHWDVSLTPKVPFALQGILYLSDTEAEQGAFTCVPGFHKQVDAWVASLPPDSDPRQQDLTAFGPTPIPGRAGDLIIWHQALPHGSRPNRATRPRIVQYFTMRPTRWEAHQEWR